MPHHLMPPALGRYTAFALLWGFTACESQFSPGYLGESLLTVSGSVEIMQDRTEGKLTPALAFANEGTGTVTIMETEVKGEFPADFRLDVFEEPPLAALYFASHLREAEPRIAIGYITAVASSHPASIRYATSQVTTVSAACLDPACERYCETEGTGCPRSDEWCTYDHTACYKETFVCPTLSSPDADCQVEVQGDPSLKELPWSYFAGFSQNYLAVYLERPAPANSWTATMLGSPQGLPKGYGLFAVRRLTEAEQLAADDCFERAEVLVTADFNAHNGTNYPDISPQACITCADGNCPPPPSFCSIPIEEFDARQAELDSYRESGRLKLGCPLSSLVATRIVNPAHESVSVRIGPDLMPEFSPVDR